MFSTLPLVVLKQVILFESGITVSGVQQFSVTKTLFLCFRALGDLIPLLDVLDGLNPFLVYIGPLFFGIGLYLTPILIYFELDNRDVYLKEFGFEPEVPDHQVHKLGRIIFATILLMDITAIVFILVKNIVSRVQ